MGDIIIRFLIGGLFVTAFAMIGDLFKPKSFAGIFGAAPSVALATLALTLSKNGVLHHSSQLCVAMSCMAVGRVTTKGNYLYTSKR